jgi:regulator of protease activity HflC (stomatin/prohibitin superfamily)
MRFTKTLLLLLIAVLALFSTGCSRVKVPSGNVGVQVNMYGEDRGVDAEILGTGRYWINPFNEEIHVFPTFEQNYVWTRSSAEGSPNNEEISFQTIEGMNCTADFGIAYTINPDSVASIFQRYRLGVEEITDIKMRNVVRDAVNQVSSQLEVEAIYGAGKNDFVDSVESIVQTEFATQGITVSRLSLIGNVRIPANVTQALNAKIEATQRAQQRENEIREADARAEINEANARGEAQARVAQANGNAEALLVEARAQAEANRLLSRSLTDNLVEYEQIQKWNGVLPVATGGGALLDLRSTMAASN